MLDEKGRLFGKINIVDLLIVVIIIAAIAFIGLKYVLPAREDAQSGQPVTMVLYAESSKKYVVENLTAGVPVCDNGDKAVLGTLESWSSDKYVERYTKDGMLFESAPEDTCIVELVVKGTGTKGDFGVTIDGSLYGIGHTMVVYCGDSKFFVSVKDIIY